MHSKPGLLGFEHKSHRLLSTAAFARRLATNFGAASTLVLLSLLAGMCGYRYLGDMTWISAFENAAMILSGMGPVASMPTNAGKIFAGCYALYSGLVIIIATGVMLAPVIHRFMHKLHLEEE